MKVYGVTMKVSIGDVDFIPPHNDELAKVNLEAVERMVGEVVLDQLVSLNNSLDWYMEDGCNCKFISSEMLIDIWEAAGKPVLDLHAHVTDGWHIWNRWGAY